MKNENKLRPAGFSRPTVAVFVGGCLGTGARWALDQFLSPWGADHWPLLRIALGVVTVNLLGTMLLGAWKTGAPGRAGSNLDLFLATGILGSFTTYSSFILSVRSDPLGWVQLQILAILVFGLVAAGLGSVLGTWLHRGLAGRHDGAALAEG